MKKLSGKFKEEVLKQFEIGLTANEVSRSLNEKYRKETGEDMTRNAALGIKFRAGRCMKGKSFTRGKAVFTDEKVLDKLGFIKRKCLSCLQEKILEKHLRICDICKRKEEFNSSVETYSARF